VSIPRAREPRELLSPKIRAEIELQLNLNPNVAVLTLCDTLREMRHRVTGRLYCSESAMAIRPRFEFVYARPGSGFFLSTDDKALLWVTQTWDFIKDRDGLINSSTRERERERSSAHCDCATKESGN